MHSRTTEKQLDTAFAERFINDAAFRAWVFGASKFAQLHTEARLLSDDLSKSRRMSEHSWRHVWCVMPDGSSGETDIFMVFETTNGLRFSMHFENKPPRGVFRDNQAEGYSKRAAFLAGHPRYLRYDQWETILLAPSAFLDRHPDKCVHFDRAISYEAIADWVPLFRQTLNEVATG